MATWTYDTVDQSDKNYLDSFDAAGWRALTIVEDIHHIELSTVDTATKRKAILDKLADELNLGSVPEVTWVDITGGKMAILVVGSNTITIRVSTALKKAYLEIFLTSKFPPTFISQMMKEALAPATMNSISYYVDTRIPRY